ncbi:MAG: YybS family protein [Syntrophobacteraceae bacterium]
MNLNEGHPGFRSASAGKEFFFQIVLTLSLFLSISFIPLIGFFPGVLTPTPTALSMLRWGRPLVWVVPGCSALIGAAALFLMDLSLSIPYFLGLLAMGVVLGHGIKSEWPVEKVVGLSTLVMVLMSGLLLLAAFVESGGELVRLLEQDLKNTITGTFKQLGTPSAERQELETALLDIVPLMVRVIPGVLVASTLAVSWLNLLVSRRYCRAAAVESCLREKLALWKAPEPMVWFVIGAGLMLLLPVDGLWLLGLNILIVLGGIYFLHGLAIVSFYFEKWKLPFLARGLIYALLFLQQFAAIATAVLGLFDIWFDFRKLVKKPA